MLTTSLCAATPILHAPVYCVLTADMRFREALRHIEQDPRFAALEQPRDREVRLPQPWDGA